MNNERIAIMERVTVSGGKNYQNEGRNERAREDFETKLWFGASQDVGLGGLAPHVMCFFTVMKCTVTYRIVHYFIDDDNIARQLLLRASRPIAAASESSKSSLSSVINGHNHVGAGLPDAAQPKVSRQAQY